MATLPVDRDYMVSSTYAVQNFSQVKEKSKEKPVFLTKNNDIENVLLSIEEYEAMLEFIQELQEDLEHAHIYDKIKERRANFNEEDSFSLEEAKKILNE